MSTNGAKLNINPRTAKLFEISKHVTENELKTLKILCADSIPAGILEKITSVLELFKKLEELDDSGDGGNDFLSQLFWTIGRKDLHRKLNGQPGSSEEEKSTSKSQVKLRNVLLLVSTKIGKDCRRLGRYLDVDDDSIDRIDADQNKVLDKSYAILKEWENEKGADATLENLISGLDKMGRRDIIKAIRDLSDEGDSTLAKKPLQETDGPVSQKRDQETTTHGMTQTTSTSAQQPKNATPAASNCKYNINSHNGVVLVGDMGRMTIEDGHSANFNPMPRTTANDNPNHTPPNEQTSSLPQNSSNQTATGKYNINIYGGSHSIGDGQEVRIIQGQPRFIE